MRQGLIRTFIAVDIDNEAILSRIKPVLDELISTGADMKPVELHNMHITLRFIGEIPKPMVDSIARMLSELRFKKFKIHIKGVGAFPTPTRPRVVWLGVVEGHEQLKEIHDWIEERLQKLGFKREKEEFVPHITLARVRSSRNIKNLVEAIMRLKDVDIGEFIVDKVRLKKSTLTPRGPIYDTLFEVKAEE